MGDKNICLCKVYPQTLQPGCQGVKTQFVIKPRINNQASVR